MCMYVLAIMLTVFHVMMNDIDWRLKVYLT